MDLDHLVWKYIDDPGGIDRRIELRYIVPVKMSMTVKMVARLGKAEEPAQCLQTVVCRVGIIMDAKGRGMADKDIQSAAVANAVEDQSWNHVDSAQVSFGLGVLVGPVGAVADGSAKAADQVFFVAHSSQVQI